MIAPAPADTVLLIHGPCVRSLGWEHWVGRYAARGFGVFAGTVPSQRRPGTCLAWYDDARERTAALAAADYYTGLIRTMAAPPILIGHCFGGVVVQLLVDRGLGAAGVLLGVPPVPAGSGAAGLSVDYRSPWRVPVLVAAAGRDRHVPPEMAAATVLRYQQSAAVTGFLEYPDRCHHWLHAPGWEYVADDVLDWALLHTDPAALIGTDRR